MALRNLLQAKRRTALLFLALSLVTFLLVMLSSLSAGLSQTLIRSATTLTSGHVNVAGFYKERPTDAGPMVTNSAAVRKIVEANTPGLDYVIDRVRGWAKVISETGAMQAGLSGVSIAEEQRFVDALQLAPESEYVEGGREEIIGDPKRLAEPASALIFAAQAKRLGVRVGDQLVVSIETFEGNTTEVTVVAVAKDVGFMSNWSVFMPKETIRELYQVKPDTTGNVMIYLKDSDKASEVMGHLREVLQKEGYGIMEHVPQPFWAKFETVSGEDWVGQKLDLTIWEDEVAYLMFVITGLDTLTFFLVFILTLIIIIGILNAMWIAVRERTGEIGTIRAIGMSRMKVLRMFVAEAALLGLAASTAGAVVGGLIAWGIDAAQFSVPFEAMRVILLSDRLHLAVEPAAIVRAVVSFTFVTVLASLWPAIRASRLQPVTAIRAN